MNKKCALFASLATLLFTTVTLADLDAFATTPTLTYSYSGSYGNGTLTINNTGNQPITIQSLTFDSNANVQGTPWGSLFAYLAKFKNSAESNGVAFTNTLTEPAAGVTIPAGGNATLSFSATLAGPLALDGGVDKVVVNGTMPVSIESHCSGSACNDPFPGKRVFGYYTDWSFWQNYDVTKLAYDKINAVHYAFLIFDQDGKVQLYDTDSDPKNMPTIIAARQRFPYLNFSLSLGGWSWASSPSGWICPTGASPSGPPACFSALAANPANTAIFIKNAVAAMRQVHANGLDIDWEYPQPSDAANYVALLQGLRQALDTQGKQDGVHYYLTIAAPAGVDKISNLNTAQWTAVAKAVDYIDVMTYDFHGAWDQFSDFMTPMKLDPVNDPYKNPPANQYDIQDALAAYTKLGISNAKIIIGVPLYGRLSAFATQTHHALEGLYQPTTGVTPPGEYDKQAYGNSGMFNYNCIIDPTTCNGTYPMPALTLIDPTTDPLGKYSQTPWGYSNQYFITYDDAKSAALKASYMKQNGYAGIMYWSLDGDFPDTDPRSILNSVYQTLATAAPSPQSSPANMRGGSFSLSVAGEGVTH